MNDLIEELTPAERIRLMIVLAERNEAVGLNGQQRALFHKLFEILGGGK